MPKRWILALVTLSALSVAHGQDPAVPRDFLENRRQIEGDQIAFCVHVNALLADLEQALVRELADVLLLSPSIREIDPPRAVPPLDYRLPLLYEEMFVFLTDDCRAFAGVTLTSAGYPDWLIFTRPTYVTEFVLATTNEEYRTLGDVPAGHTIGTRQMSAADIGFATYVGSLPDSQRWQRAPYPYDQLLIERLREGRLETAFVWAPALYAATDGDPEAAGIRIIPSDPFDPPDVDFGLALRAREEFVRTLLDDAIEALIEDGTMAALLDEYSVPGRPARLGR